MPDVSVLVLGASGQTGAKIAGLLDGCNGVRVRRVSRDVRRVESWRARGLDAVRLDLGDPVTFDAALERVDRIYLLTSYTIEMVTQAKMLVDAAVRHGVSFIVHQGIAGAGDSTVPHFAWHELVERYVEGSGIAWCHLHPGYFMENLISVMPLREGTLDWYMSNVEIGWVALDDLARLAARVLAEGPALHEGRHYAQSTEVLDGRQAASQLSEVLGMEVSCEAKEPGQLLPDIDAGVLQPGVEMELNYAMSGLELMRQVVARRMPTMHQVQDDALAVTGSPSLSFRAWARAHAEQLVGQLR